MDEYFKYSNDISIKEVNEMISDIEDLLMMIEHFNEVLAFKMKIHHPSFSMFLRNLQINNCYAISNTLQVKSILDKAVENYFLETNNAGHG